MQSTDLRFATRLQRARKLRRSLRERTRCTLYRQDCHLLPPSEAMPYAAESIVVTAAREAKKIWPFMAGMGLVGAAVVKVTASATPEVRFRRLRRVLCTAWSQGCCAALRVCGPLARGALG